TDRGVFGLPTSQQASIALLGLGIYFWRRQRGQPAPSAATRAARGVVERLPRPGVHGPAPPGHTTVIPEHIHNFANSLPSAPKRLSMDRFISKSDNAIAGLT